MEIENLYKIFVAQGRATLARIIIALSQPAIEDLIKDRQNFDVILQYRGGQVANIEVNNRLKAGADFTIVKAND